MTSTFVPGARLAGLVSCVSLIVSVVSSTGVAAQTGPAANWTTVAAPAELNVPGAQWIKVNGRDGHNFLAAVLRPQGAGPFPVVVVLHGASGLQPSHLALADEVARAGFLVVVGCWQFVASPPAPVPNPICSEAPPQAAWQADPAANSGKRSEEHTSELQSRLHLVCRLLLEKKKTTMTTLDSRASSTPLAKDA